MGLIVTAEAELENSLVRETESTLTAEGLRANHLLASKEHQKARLWHWKR